MFVQLLEEGATPSDIVTKSNLNSWISAIGVPFTTAMDADGAAPFTLKTTLGIKETTYIVDRATMKILAKTSGASAGLDKLDALP